MKINQQLKFRVTHFVLHFDSASRTYTRSYETVADDLTFVEAKLLRKSNSSLMIVRK